MKYLLFVFFFGIVIFSCNKRTLPSTLNGKVKEFKIKLIQKYAQGDSAAYFIFSYDNIGRVNHFWGYYGDSGMILHPEDTIMAMDFFYNGSNLLPSKVSVRKRLLSNDSRTHYFLYSADQKLTSDSIVYEGSSYAGIFNYNYKNNYIISMYHDASTYQSIDSFNIVGNNIISHIHKELGGDKTTFEYEFDNGLNTLNNLNIAPIFFALNLPQGIENTFWSSWTLSNRNNIIKAKRIINNDTPEILGSSSYFYNNDGVLTSRVFNYGLGPQDLADTMFYKY